MAKVKIDFVFAGKDKGQIKTEAEGFEGAKCMETTKLLLDAVAKREVDQKFKNDYYVNENAVNIGV